jgi:hypothetical protein
MLVFQRPFNTSQTSMSFIKSKIYEYNIKSIFGLLFLKYEYKIIIKMTSIIRKACVH